MAARLLWQRWAWYEMRTLDSRAPFLAQRPVQAGQRLNYVAVWSEALAVETERPVVLSQGAGGILYNVCRGRSGMMVDVGCSGVGGLPAGAGQGRSDGWGASGWVCSGRHGQLHSCCRVGSCSSRKLQLFAVWPFVLLLHYAGIGAMFETLHSDGPAVFRPALGPDWP